MNRRVFLSTVAASFSLATFGNVRAPFARREIFLSGYESNNEVGMKIVTPEGTKSYPLKNEIHSVVYSAQDDIKVFIPKINKVAYGWVKKGPLVPFAPAAGHAFYGHGVIDAKRNLLYTTQSAPLEDGNVPGKIHVYSLPEFKLVDEFPSFGSGPHDLSIVRDELIVCNGGAKPNMAHINLATKKLIRSYPASDNEISFTHCARIDEQTYVVASTVRDLKKACPLFLFKLGEGLKEFETPSDIKSEFLKYQLLSVISHEGYVYATCPSTNALLAWTNEGRFIGLIPIVAASSLAISVNHGGILVGSSNANEPFWLAKVVGGELNVAPLTDFPSAKGSGAHALIIS